jgi:hypothetical protein
MIVIATHNGKEYLKRLLSNLESFNLDKEIAIIDTMSSDKESLDFLYEITNKNLYNLNIKIHKTEYRGFDSGAYIYAINNLSAERFYFLQDSIIIKDREFFDITDNILESGVVTTFISFPSNFYNTEQYNYCSSTFGTTDYDTGIFGPMFSILNEDIQKIDKSLLVYPKNKEQQMAMERGWSIIFKKYNFTIKPIEGEKDDDRLFNNKYKTFTKEFPYRL